MRGARAGARGFAVPVVLGEQQLDATAGAPRSPALRPVRTRSPSDACVAHAGTRRPERSSSTRQTMHEVW